MFVEMISDFSSEIPVKKLLEPIIVVYKFLSGLKACTKPIGPILFKFAENPVLSYNKCRNKVKKMLKIKINPQFGLKLIFVVQYLIFIPKKPGCEPHLRA